MLDTTLQNQVEALFNKLKQQNSTFVSHRFAWDGVPFVLHPITYDDSENQALIRLLARWRSRANYWFPSQFKVTQKGTRIWLKDQLLDKKDRILFLAYRENDPLPFAHVGLYRFDYQKKLCEIDNVIRGRTLPKTKGVMAQIVNEISYWSFLVFDLKKVELEVVSENEKAVRMYERAGFHEEKRIPLRKVAQDGRITWVEDATLDIESAERSDMIMAMYRT